MISSFHTEPDHVIFFTMNCVHGGYNVVDSAANSGYRKLYIDTYKEIYVGLS